MTRPASVLVSSDFGGMLTYEPNRNTGLIYQRPASNFELVGSVDLDLEIASVRATEKLEYLAIETINGSLLETEIFAEETQSYSNFASIPRSDIRRLFYDSLQHRILAVTDS